MRPLDGPTWGSRLPGMTRPTLAPPKRLCFAAAAAAAVAEGAGDVDETKSARVRLLHQCAITHTVGHTYQSSPSLFTIVPLPMPLPMFTPITREVSPPQVPRAQLILQRTHLLLERLDMVSIPNLSFPLFHRSNSPHTDTNKICIHPGFAMMLLCLRQLPFLRPLLLSLPHLVQDSKHS